jgi:hypothetical protein
LPFDARKQAFAAYRLFKRNPQHPSLQFKRIHNTKPRYSVRIGVHYRALGRLEGNTIIWVWIGTHAEYDKFLKHLK